MHRRAVTGRFVEVVVVRLGTGGGVTGRLGVAVVVRPGAVGV
ncbi:hypothetical protein [Streptomyces sp. NPDC046197]